MTDDAVRLSTKAPRPPRKIGMSAHLFIMLVVQHMSAANSNRIGFYILSEPIFTIECKLIIHVYYQVADNSVLKNNKILF